MTENNQLSDETKNNSTDTSSTDVSSAVIGNHKNAIVPHKISNHDKLVQTMVMVDGEWINVNDTNDQANVKYDMHKVNKKVVEAQKGIVEAKNSAESAVKYADSAVSASKVNSDAIAAQSSAIIEAKSAMDSATAEIQQLKANAASDVAQIRADVAQVQNEVDTAKAANSASVDKLKSDIGLVQKDLDNVHDSLTKAQSAVEQNQKLINDSVTKINSDIAQSRQDIITAQQANNDLTKQLDTYSKEAQEQGKTIKSIQDKQDGFSATIADVKGNVSKVSDTVDGLTAGLKDAQGNIASVKAQADQLNVTLTDHSKNINQLIATAKELSSTLKDADGRLSKVEQTAKEHSSTLSDLQGNLSQVKQTATDLVTTLKDAQGNIDQIKQDAKGTLEQLSNVQGDITALQKDVGGIKLTIADHDKNIHTLQADSETLKDDMQDAQGNISSLQKTATSLTSEMQDHAGRISKVEQTASTLTNEFSDQQDHLNRVEQTANGTKQTVADQQDQINTIKTDANGIHETLTGQGNQIATINTTLSGLNTKYEGVSGDLSKLRDQTQWVTVTSAVDLNNIKTPCHKFLKGVVNNAPNEPAWWYLTVEGSDGSRITQTVIADQSNNRYTRRWNDSEWSTWVKDATQTDVTALSNRITTNSTQIDQNKKSIALKADQATVDNLSGEVSRNTAQLKVQADQISSKVSSEDFSALDNKVGSAIAQIDKNTTAIDQTNKQISLKADQTVVDTIKNTATQNSSRLDVMDKAIQSKVTSTDVNNIINEKGFTTQSTVQSLIEQKAGTLNESITKLDSKIDESGGGINLQGGTADCSLPIGSNGPQITIENYDDHTKMIHAVGSKSGFYIGDDKGRFIPEVGETYTFSADIKGKGTINGDLFRYEGADSSSMGSITLNNNWQRIKTTVHVSQLSGTWIIYPNPGNGNNDFYVKDIKIERGSIDTPYSQAPSDNASITQLQSVTASIDGLQSAVKNKVDQSQYTQLAGVVQTKVSQSDFNRLNKQVNVQTLDNANIDNMKTTGHYFVHNLTGNPLGGWVYVDVTGNANDRIRQDVYQDSGTKHAFRRWFGTYWTGWSTGAEESEITQLRSDINLRVKSGDLLSQINIAAGHTLIQSNKIYFDADSFVMSPNSKAFIPSAYITNINADKITTGTLDAAKFNVRNFSADNISGGMLNGIKFRTELMNDNRISIMGDRIAWTSNTSFGEQLNGWIDNSTSGIDWLSFRDLSLHAVSDVGIDTKNTDDITRWTTSDYDPYDQPGLMISSIHNFIPDQSKYDETVSPDQSNAVLLASTNTYISVKRGTGILAHLDSRNFANSSIFSIQKDNKVGFYVGQGKNGNQVNVQFAGDDSGFNIRGNFNVYGAKNSAVKTSQGDVAVSAYETAEYYFGDIGEGQTGDSGIAFVGIEKLFNETVNTNIPYQVFITAYGPGNLWVDQREHDRFVVKSDRPNVKFCWEIKAKRRGYENTRLQKVN